MQTNNKQNKDIPFIASALEVIESFVIAVACVICIFVFVARLSVVSGDSMNNTLEENDYILVVNFFNTYDPDNGDIVVIHGNYQYYNTPIVKRVIATEGQTIKIDRSKRLVYVDDVLLDEEYAFYKLGGAFIIPETPGGHYDYTTGIFTATVPEGHIFVMGDNRLESADSRVKEIGFVNVDNVLGKAVLRVAPFSKIGSLN